MSRMRLSLALVGVALLQACATSTQVTPLEANIAPRAGACNVQVLAREAAVPQGMAQVAKIESHISRNMFFGGRVTLVDEAYAELRKKACEVGGDMVHVDDSMESSAAEMTHVHVWGTVYRGR